MTKSEAYQRGSLAMQAGKPMTRNPYKGKDRNSAVAWSFGWTDAQKRAEERARAAGIVAKRPFAYSPNVAKLAEREAAAAMMADHVFVHHRSEANPQSSMRMRHDRSNILEWMRERGDTTPADLAVMLQIDTDRAAGILSDLATWHAIQRVSEQKAARAVYRLD